MKSKIKIIQISCDGGAATGKSTGAKMIAKKYKLKFLSSGLLYRYASLILINNKPKNKINFLKRQIKKLNLKELQNKRLIDDEVAQITSILSKNLRIRRLVHNFQKNIAYKIPKGFKGSILNGRDITYKIIPDATFKFYVTANILAPVDFPIASPPSHEI